MIESATTFLAGELDRFLRQNLGDDGELAVVSAVVGDDGHEAQGTQNKVIITLINVERDAVLANSTQRFRNNPAMGDMPVEFVAINLALLISARFDDDYRRALKALSAVVAFFHAHPVFSAQSGPGLPAGLDRMTVEARDIDLSGLRDLWSIHGGRYLPSAVFLARMLVENGAWLGAAPEPIIGVGLVDG